MLTVSNERAYISLYLVSDSGCRLWAAGSWVVGMADDAGNVEHTIIYNAAAEQTPGNTLKQVATAINDLATMMQQLASNTQVAQQTAEAAGTEAQQANVTVANDAARAKFKPLRPDKFTGDGQPTVADWCDSIDDYLVATGLVNTPMIVNHVSSYFSGEAKTWWGFYKERANRGAVRSPLKWAAFRDLITDHFSEKLQKRRAMDELQTLRQSGTVRDYTAEFQAIVIELPDLDEEYVRYRYVLGLNPDIQQAVEQQTPATLDRAIELANLADSIARRIVTSRGAEQVTVAKPVRDRQVPQPVQQGTPMELGAVSTERKCYSCGRVGHIAARYPHQKRN